MGDAVALQSGIAADLSTVVDAVSHAELPTQRAKAFHFSLLPQERLAGSWRIPGESDDLVGVVDAIGVGRDVGPVAEIGHLGMAEDETLVSRGGGERLSNDFEVVDRVSIVPVPVHGGQGWSWPLRKTKQRLYPSLSRA